jgi:endonuclease YncB( thermonuclease family)
MRAIVIIAAAFAIASSNTAYALSGSIEGAAWVKDGDTVFVKGIEVRLKGVDAMEQATREGRAATEGMRAIVGNWLRCELTGEKTRGREVGYCTNGASQDIGQELVSRGLALACPHFSKRYVPFEKPDAEKRLSRASYCIARTAAPNPTVPTSVLATADPAGAVGDNKITDRPRRPGIRCMYPDDRDAAGRRCGKRAASIRSGGR